MKNYNVRTVSRTATPRSKRLREAGVSVSGVIGSSAPATGGSDISSNCDGHTHSNKAALDAISIDNAFYLWLKQKIEGEDNSSRQKVKAGFADDAAHATESDHSKDSDLWAGHKFADYMDQPVRKSDIVEFAKAILGIVVSPDFISGIETGCGWKIDEGGNGEMTSLTLRSFLKVPTLIYNKVRVTGGEMWNTEGGTIAEVAADPDSDTAFILTMDLEDGDTIELDVDDICKGHYNSSGGFVTSYFRVTAVDQPSKTMRIVLGADSEVPGGINHPPVAYMNIARYGNFTNKERQRSQYFSSSDQRISLLCDVDQYIIEPKHYKVVIGNIPDALIPADLPIQGQPSIYLDNVLARNFYQIDKTGSVVKTIRDRGLWEADPAEEYQCNSEIQDDVYHKSCKYRCLVEGTAQEPRYDSTDWLLIAGDTTLVMAIESTAGETFLYGALSTELIATVKRGQEDITDGILDADWSWSRDTGNPADDTIWNTDHAGSGRQISLSNEDLTTSSGRFICTAYVRDGAVSLTEEVQF